MLPSYDFVALPAQSGSSIRKRPHQFAMKEKRMVLEDDERTSLGLLVDRPTLCGASDFSIRLKAGPRIIVTTMRFLERHGGPYGL